MDFGRLCQLLPQRSCCLQCWSLCGFTHSGQPVPYEVHFFTSPYSQQGKTPRSPRDLDDQTGRLHNDSARLIVVGRLPVAATTDETVKPHGGSIWPVPRRNTVINLVPPKGMSQLSIRYSTDLNYHFLIIFAPKECPSCESVTNPS